MLQVSATTMGRSDYAHVCDQRDAPAPQPDASPARSNTLTNGDLNSAATSIPNGGDSAHRRSRVHARTKPEADEFSIAENLAARTLSAYEIDPVSFAGGYPYSIDDILRSSLA
jgi:hypothetical protein